MQTSKILFSFCCQNGLVIEQVDVVTAFLNGEISSEVYVDQPKGYSDGTKKDCKLRKALYGLWENLRAWYKCWDEYLTKTKFKRNNVDYCLYRRLSRRTSYLGAWLKYVVSHQAVEERRISPRGRRTSYLTGRFKNDASCRADEERRISRVGEERRISPGGSRRTHLAARTENDGSRAYFFLEIL